MSTNPRVFARRNRQKPCTAPGCRKFRRRTSAWCRGHERRVHVWGHPDGKVITKKTLAPYRTAVARFLDQHIAAGHSSTILALSIIQEFLQAEAAKGRASTYTTAPPTQLPHPRKRTRAYPACLRLSSILRDTYGDDVEAMARDVLVVAASVWWFSARHRHRLPDDQRLTLMIGYHVLALARFPRREIWGGGELVRTNTLSPGGPQRREVGEFLRSRLGVFFGKLVEGVEAYTVAQAEAKATKQVDQRQTLAAAFETVNGYLARTSEHADWRRERLVDEE